MKAAKGTCWEGTVISSTPDKSPLTVHYDRSTRWVSQEHSSTKVNDIDPGQVKENDRVICKGTREKDGSFHSL
jgi:hypothetical protein